MGGGARRGTPTGSPATPRPASESRAICSGRRRTSGWRPGAWRVPRQRQRRGSPAPGADSRKLLRAFARPLRSPRLRRPDPRAPARDRRTSRWRCAVLARSRVQRGRSAPRVPRRRSLPETRGTIASHSPAKHDSAQPQERTSAAERWRAHRRIPKLPATSRILRFSSWQRRTEEPAMESQTRLFHTTPGDLPAAPDRGRSRRPHRSLRSTPGSVAAKSCRGLSDSHRRRRSRRDRRARAGSSPGGHCEPARSAACPTA